MYNIKQQGDTVQNGIMEFVADTRADIDKIPTKWGMGSTCLVIEDSSNWILGSDKEWHLKETNSSGLDLQQAIEIAIAESKLYTDKAISELSQFNITIVNSLPIENIKTHTIYFVVFKKCTIIFNLCSCWH
jgi:hypothetical protein